MPVPATGRRGRRSREDRLPGAGEPELARWPVLAREGGSRERAAGGRGGQAVRRCSARRGTARSLAALRAVAIAPADTTSAPRVEARISGAGRCSSAGRIRRAAASTGSMLSATAPQMITRAGSYMLPSTPTTRARVAPTRSATRRASASPEAASVSTSRGSTGPSATSRPSAPSAGASPSSTALRACSSRACRRPTAEPTPMMWSNTTPSPTPPWAPCSTCPSTTTPPPKRSLASRAT